LRWNFKIKIFILAPPHSNGFIAVKISGFLCVWRLSAAFFCPTSSSLCSLPMVPLAACSRVAKGSAALAASAMPGW
jgi:hypothetical protein